CFIWPTLEAFVSDGETEEGLPRVVGIYNVVWASTAALAVFTGGSIVQVFGYRSLFILPLVVMLAMLGLTYWLQGHGAAAGEISASHEHARAPHQPGSPDAATFLKMAWLANPFAYIAIQTLIAVMPGIAAKFDLSHAQVGLVCWLWCFVRVGTFFALWH